MFRPQIRDREWPDSANHFSIIQTARRPFRRLQQLILSILRTPLNPANGVELGMISAAIKESLLTAVDDVLMARVDTEASRATATASRQRQNVDDIRNAISQDMARPIYSEEIASQVGLSVRTLQSVVDRFRGMSFHRYVRLRRLWLVRQQLLTGTTSVKAAALATGFWHLSDFARMYRAMFGETPSETLARSNGNPPAIFASSGGSLGGSPVHSTPKSM